MKKLLIIILGLIGVAQAQTVGQFRYDTTKFLKSPGFNEVKIQNKTMDSLGIAVNKGKGWLQWERPKAVPGGIKIGNDTILISTDTTSLSNRINLKVNISDTASMLTNYAKTSAVALKVNISDTSAMLKPYLDTLQAHNTRIIAAGGGGASGWSLTGNSSAVTDFLGTTNNRTMRFRTNNVQRMVIDSIGRVGIGTSSPINALDVVGEARISGQILTLSNGSPYILFTSAGNTGIIGDAPSLVSGASAGLGIRTSFAVTFGSGGRSFAVLNNDGFVQADGSITAPGRTKAASAVGDFQSTTRGFLIPRMTTAERDAISTPATALQVFSTTDSTNYIYRGTTSGWQATITGIRGSGTLDFGSITHHSEEVLTISVTGAAEGDVVSIGVPNASNLTNVIFNAWVSAANTVSVKCSNLDQSAAKDPASGTFKVTVFK